MDNHSIPNPANTLLASSHASEHSTPLQSLDQMRLLNDKETIFIQTLRNIETGHISQPEEFDPALSGLLRKVANHLLQAMQKDGLQGYWKSYIAIFINNGPPFSIQGVWIISHSLFYFFFCQM